MTGNMPDITKVQVGAALMWIVSQAVAYGWLSHSPNQEVLSGAATVIALALTWADAHLRGKRAIAHATVTAATVAANSNQAIAAKPPAGLTTITPPSSPTP